MKFLLSLFGCLNIFSLGVGAMELNCSIDLRQEGEVISDRALYVRDFHFDTNSPKGKIIAYKGMKVSIWGGKDKFFLKLEGGEQGKAPLLVQFPLSSRKKREKGQNYYFKVGLRTQIYCDPRKEKGGRGEQGKKDVSKEVAGDELLATFQKRVIFGIEDYLTFPREQREENGLMRTLFFQGSRIYEASRQLNKKAPWCGLRVRMESSKSTVMEKGTRLHPQSFYKHQNNPRLDNYSYGFSFQSGKDGWRPFTFQCSLLRGTVFNYHLFKEIVGGKVKILKK